MNDYPEWYDGDKPLFHYPRWEFATMAMGLGEGWWTCYEHFVVYIAMEGKWFREVMYRRDSIDQGIWGDLFSEDGWQYLETGAMTVEEVKEQIPNLIMENLL